MKSLSAIFISAFFLSASPFAVGQEISYACKTVGGFVPSKGDGPEYDRLPGKCDASGLLQGDGAAAMIGAGNNRAILRSTFVDGLPSGPSVLRLVGRLECKLDFQNPTKLGTDIACIQDNKFQTTYSSPEGFNLNHDSRKNFQLSAATVLVSKTGPVFISEIGARPFPMNGKLFGVLSKKTLSLHTLLIELDDSHQSNDEPWGVADVKSELSENRDQFTTGLGIKSIEGFWHMRKSQWLLPQQQFLSRNLAHSALMKPGIVPEHPADREFKVNYVDGTWIRGIATSQRGFLYYQDSTGREFNALIKECFHNRRGPGAVYLDGYEVVTSKLRPTGCGSYKTANQPEVRGVFSEAGFKPF